MEKWDIFVRNFDKEIIPNFHVLRIVVCVPMKIRHAGRKQLEAYSVKLDDCTVILSGIPERVISPNEMNYSFLQTRPNFNSQLELGWGGVKDTTANLFS